MSEHTSSARRPNRLLREKSPHLLQHAYNPVDWYPWGDGAFERAGREDRPVFLSIGYATCHWCHVMERECFGDPDVARLMNETFVSIKVDREERPDLDHLYMTVSQMLTGGGGWPLNVVMTPEKHPFFAATYIPKESLSGRTGMMELIPRIAQAWKERRKDVLRSTQDILAALEAAEARPEGKEPGMGLLDQAFRELGERYDPVWGGFGPAPKFPTPHVLGFLLRHWQRYGSPEALSMVETTLVRMRAGGIYDQVEHGFHRYSTDRSWLLPHFEKMLYDQALLAMVYLEAFQATGRTLFARTAREIFGYVLRDMTSPEGAFCCAEDADSEGREGAFYLWEESELRALLPPKEAEAVIRLYGVLPEGNFQDAATGRRTGANILYQARPMKEAAQELGLPAERLEALLLSARERLLAHRLERPRPLRDDKILTDWNGLMIASLAQGAQVLGEDRYLAAALKAASFLLGRMQDPQGRLLHRYREGEAAWPGNLDDYAALIWGLWELYQASLEPAWLLKARALAQRVLEDFTDPAEGGFFFTSSHGEALPVRKKEVYDGAIPSGNAVMLLNLLRLSRIFADPGLEKASTGMLKAFSGLLEARPSAYTHLLQGLDFALGPTQELVLVGRPEAPDTQALLKVVRRRFLPRKTLVFCPVDGPDLEEPLQSLLKGYIPVGDRATVYVCENETCLEPMTEPEALARVLRLHVPLQEPGS